MAIRCYMIWSLSHFLLLLLLFTLLQPQWPPFFIMNMLSLVSSQGCSLCLEWSSPSPCMTFTSLISWSSNTNFSFMRFLTIQSKVALSFTLDHLILFFFIVVLMTWKYIIYFFMRLSVSLIHFQLHDSWDLLVLFATLCARPKTGLGAAQKLFLEK